MTNIKSLKNNLAISFLLLLNVTILLFFCKQIIRLFPSMNIGTLNIVVLFITFLALVWYAWETKKMKEQVIEQTKLLICPFLVINPKNETLATGGSYKEFKIRNVGKGVALKIQFSKCKICKGKGNIPGIKKSPTLMPGEEKDIIVKESVVKGRSWPMKDKAEPFSSINDNVKNVTIKFEDIRGNEYKSKISLKN